MHVLIDYPPSSQERAILHLARDEFGNVDHPPPVELGEDEILDIRAELGALYMADSVERYIVDLVAHSRSGMEGVEYAASPRATIALDQCARTLAWLAGRDYVVPEDVLEIAHDVFRHRLILSFEAEAKGTTTDDVIDTMIEQVTLT